MSDHHRVPAATSQCNNQATIDHHYAPATWQITIPRGVSNHERGGTVEVCDECLPKTLNALMTFSGAFCVLTRL